MKICPAILLSFITVAMSAQTISVSPDGPIKTLAEARDAARALRRSGKAGPITITVRAGTYYLPETLVLGPEDSDTVWEAAHGEHPVISGGRIISGWERVQDKKLNAQAGGDLWMARVPDNKRGKWSFRELFVDGHRRPRARSPKTGFFQMDGEMGGGTQAQFKFHAGDVHAAWADQGDAEVVALEAWAEARMYIRRVDEATHTVTLSGAALPSNHEANARYWVENTLDALDASGEWYLDRQNSVVYYRPMPGEDMTRVQVIAPVLGQLVRFEGSAAMGWVHNIRLRGLTLSHTDWSMDSNGYADMQSAYDIPAAVEGVGTRSCSIEECTLAHLGGYAVELGGGPPTWRGGREGSKEDRIVGNEMYDLGAGGIKLGDPAMPRDEGQATSGNIISDNHIHDIGTVYPAGTGIWMGQTSDNVVGHNEINDTYYTGISAGWTWGYGPTAAHGNVIEFNNIHDIGRGMLSDMGCIYTLGVQPGTVERNNLCHDVSRSVYGGWGLYTDEGSSNIVLENNVVYRTQDSGFHQHYGANNIVRNNVFAYGQEAQIRRTKLESHPSFLFEHNIVYWNLGPLFDGEWKDNEYRFDHNLYYRTDGQPIQFEKWSFEEWQKQGQDHHSLIANPLFVDPSKGNFALRPGSPAIGIGFRPIDLSHVGPRGGTIPQERQLPESHPKP